jgi:hypothetical protein
MASTANKIRRSRAARARVKAANKRRHDAIRAGELVLKPRHGKTRRFPKIGMADVLAKWKAKVLGILKRKGK